MSKVLVTFCSDWADEFTASGFAVYDKQEWADLYDKLINFSGDVTWYFGTNEGWESENPVSFAKKYEVKDLTDVEEQTLTALFGNKYDKHPNFGIFPDPNDFLDRDEEDFADDKYNY